MTTTMSTTPATAGRRPMTTAAPMGSRERYLALLAMSFALFNSLRLVSYLPTLWAIWDTQDSSQYALLTWAIWAGANLTMAAWLHENNGRRFNRAAVVSLVNSVMCVATLALILWFRF